MIPRQPHDLEETHVDTTPHALEFGAVSGDLLSQGVLATLLYFVIGFGVLGLGFLALDLLTPGNLARSSWPRPRSTSPRSCRTCGRATRGSDPPVDRDLRLPAGTPASW